FTHSPPCVNGCSGSPWTLMARPLSSTLTIIEQVSGQSCGQTALTVFTGFLFSQPRISFVTAASRGVHRDFLTCAVCVLPGRRRSAAAMQACCPHNTRRHPEVCPG